MACYKTSYIKQWPYYKTSYITQWPLLQNILHYTMACYKTSYITQWPITKHPTLHNGLLIPFNLNIKVHTTKQPIHYSISITL